MKILLCHNHYQRPGGEDRVFADEAWLLESRGHEVVRFTRHNDDVGKLGRWELAKKTLWNTDCAQQLRALIRRTRPDVMHCTNIFPLISPAAYYVAKEEGVAVVQTLHNYRAICPKAQFVRNGSACEKCLGKVVAWPAIVHGCYRESRAASAAVVAMSAYHWAKGTWNTKVDQYIALTDFAKQKLIAGGLPADRMNVKPNFVHPDPGPGRGQGRHAVYVGRLSPEKGIETLLGAWTHVRQELPLKIIGDGPLADRVRQAAQSDSRIQWLGHQPPERVYETVGQAQFLVMPSVCYETFGLTIVEAFAKGTPVIASRMGAMAELIDDGRTGLLFEPNDPVDLARKVEQFCQQAEAHHRFRQAARADFAAKYTADPNYNTLMAIYSRALGKRLPEVPSPVIPLVGDSSCLPCSPVHA